MCMYEQAIFAIGLGFVIGGVIVAMQTPESEACQPEQLELRWNKILFLVGGGLGLIFVSMFMGSSSTDHRFISGSLPPQTLLGKRKHRSDSSDDDDDDTMDYSIDVSEDDDDTAGYFREKTPASGKSFPPMVHSLKPCRTNSDCPDVYRGEDPVLGTPMFEGQTCCQSGTKAAGKCRPSKYDCNKTGVIDRGEQTEKFKAKVKPVGDCRHDPRFACETPTSVCCGDEAGPLVAGKCRDSKQACLEANMSIKDAVKSKTARGYYADERNRTNRFMSTYPTNPDTDSRKDAVAPIGVDKR